MDRPFPVRDPSKILATIAAVAFVHTVAFAAEGDLEAVIPVEALPVDPSLSTGELWTGGMRWSNPLIALQPARIARGIVTEEAEGKSRVLVLAVLGTPERDSQGKLLLDVPREHQAWCDLPGFGVPASHCFQDADGDGKLELSRKGILAAPNPLTLARVAAGEAIAPISYRPAREDELPQYRVGYASCNERGAKDAANPQYRFATSVRPAKGVLWPPPTTCNGLATALEQRDGDAPVYQFGRFKVAVSDEKGSFRTRLVEGIPPGTLLGHLALDHPLMDAAEAAGALAANLGDKPFLYFPAAPEIAETAQKGEPIVRGVVVHGLSGTLMRPLVSSGWGGSRTWPAGTSAFGVAMSSGMQPQSFAPDIVWCLRAKDDKGAWDTNCVANTKAGTRLVGAGSSLVVRGISIGSGARHVLPPVVERGPVDFGGPLLLTIRYAMAERRYVELDWTAGVEDGGERPWRLRLRRAADGSGFMLLSGMLLKVQPSADGASVTVTQAGGEMQSSEDAWPVDAYEVLKGN